MATGSHRKRRLCVEDEQLSGYVLAIDFLKMMNIYSLFSVERFIVSGDGGVTIDASRTAVRC
ncbi:MAG: hypothetical protein V3S97_10800 [Candidatus Bathyarchaeia archaeon]